jgi:S1 RNA binding domain protein
MSLEVGSVVEGKVSSITKFGAFIQLPDGNTGLVHISEVAEKYVTNVSDFLSENQIVKVKIISIDAKGKYNLSIKKAVENKKEAPRIGIPEDIDWKAKEDNLNFEERLSKFKKDSEEKFSVLKKSFEAKRGSGGYRKSAQY